MKRVKLKAKNKEKTSGAADFQRLCSADDAVGGVECSVTPSGSMPSALDFHFLFFSSGSFLNIVVVLKKESMT